MGVYDQMTPPPSPPSLVLDQVRMPSYLENLGLRQFFPQLVAALTNARIEKLKLVSFAEVSLVS